MPPETVDSSGKWKYAAFISYSHVDRDAARWLHRAIERYRIPKRLQRRRTWSGPRPDRLTPIFLDREELPSSSDLAQSIRTALDESQFLIVVCSPTAARSRWVNEEVRTFKALGRAENILCLIVAGEPGAEGRGKPGDLECFPPALRYKVVDGLVTDHGASEPLGADIRAGAGRRRDAKLKLIAGLLGASLDDLRRREQARRQRQLALIGAVSTVGCVVLAGLALAAWLARNEAQEQRLVAVQKSLTAERTAKFMVSLFEVSDPSEARGNSITAREILDRGARQIDESLHDEPQVRAELSSTLGKVYRGLGLYDSAYSLVSKARAIENQRPLEWIHETILLAELELQRGNDARAQQLYADAARLYRDAGVNDPAIDAQILIGEGGTAAVLNQLSQARGFFQEALEKSRAHNLEETTVQALESIAMADYYAGDMARAQGSYERALQARIAFSGETHPKVSESLNGLAAVALTNGDRRRAEEDWLKVLAIDRHLLGPKHPDIAATLSSLGRVELERRNFIAAVQNLDEAASIMESQQSDMHEGLLFVFSNLALAHMGTSHYKQAEPMLEKALQVAVAHDHPLQGPIMVYQADVYCHTHRSSQGLTRLDEARVVVAARYPDDPWRMGYLENVRAGCLYDLHRYSEAEAIIEASTAKVLKKWPPNTYYGRAAIERTLDVYGRAGNQAKLTEYNNLLAQK
jgi:tetratricopeptide (TPR) repeat protein